MRRPVFPLLALATLVLALPACNDQSLSPPAHTTLPGELGVPVTLRIGDVVTYDGGMLAIAFDDVVEDSRCPIEVVCIAAGNVRVRLLADHEGLPAAQFEIGWPEGPTTFYDYAGFRIEYLGLDPPRSAAHPAKRSDYRLRIAVTAL